MGGVTGIQWTDATWNPVRGCSRVSRGCVNCYAETMAARFAGPGQPYEGTIRDGRWSGVIRLVPEALALPLRWQKPRRIFVNSMSDLFHDGVPDEYIDRVFAVMWAAERHTFQVLTKRAERMRAYMTTPGLRQRWATAAAIETTGGDRLHDRIMQADMPPNVWLGVSVEDQRAAERRIPDLLATPAAVRFLSVEPLLGPVRLDRVAEDEMGATYDALRGGMSGGSPGDMGGPRVDWVIVGGESGRNARYCNRGWIRKIVEQCEAAGTACFVKQLGSCCVHERSYEEPEIVEHRHPKGGDIDEWPEELRVRQFPVQP